MRKRTKINERYDSDIINKSEEILNVAKKKNSTTDQIINKLPSSGEVLIQVVSCIRDMIEEDKRGDEMYQNTLGNLINSFNQILSDGQITKEERMLIASHIHDYAKMLHEYRILHTKEIWKTIRFFIGGVVVFVGLNKLNQNNSGGKGNNA